MSCQQTEGRRLAWSSRKPLFLFFFFDLFEGEGGRTEDKWKCGVKILCFFYKFYFHENPSAAHFNRSKVNKNSTSRDKPTLFSFYCLLRETIYLKSLAVGGHCDTIKKKGEDWLSKPKTWDESINDTVVFGKDTKTKSFFRQISSQYLRIMEPRLRLLVTTQPNRYSSIKIEIYFLSENNKNNKKRV